MKTIVLALVLGVVLVGMVSAGNAKGGDKGKEPQKAFQYQKPEPKKNAQKDGNGIPERVAALELAIAVLPACDTSLVSRVELLERVADYFLSGIQMSVTTNIESSWEKIVVSGSGFLMGKDMSGEYSHIGDLNGRFFYVKDGTPIPSNFGQVGCYVMYGTNVYPGSGNSSWCIPDYYHPWGGGCAFTAEYDYTGEHPGSGPYYLNPTMASTYIGYGGPLYVSPKSSVTTVTTTCHWEISVVTTNSP